MELQQVSRRLNNEAFWSIVDTFEDEQRRWFFTGQGRSGLVAAQIAMRFMHIGRESHVAGEATAPSIRAGDGLTVISGSGTTSTSVRHAGIARDVGAIVVVVIRDTDSPLAEMADVLLPVPVVSSGQLGGNLFEQSALIILDSVVNTLGTALGDARQRLRANHANLQ